MNESIAQFQELKDNVFLGENDRAAAKSKIFKVFKVVLAAPALVCAFGVLVALAVILSPLIPLVELWRRSLHR